MPVTDKVYSEERGRTYRLKERIGVGGMCEVWLVQSDSEEAALKYLRDDKTEKRLRKGLEKEFKIGRCISQDSPHIINYYDYIKLEDPKNRKALLMPYMVNGNLDERLKGSREGVERYSMEQKIDTARQIVNGLIRLHYEGIVHGDVKPTNILFDAHGVVKIIDFGLSYNPSAWEWLTEIPLIEYIQHILGMTGRLKGGTLKYMSPQRIAGNEPDPSDDVYSLSVLLYEMFTEEKLYNIHNDMFEFDDKEAMHLEMRKEMRRSAKKRRVEEKLEEAGTGKDIRSLILEGLSYNEYKRCNIRDMWGALS